MTGSFQVETARFNLKKMIVTVVYYDYRIYVTITIATFLVVVVNGVSGAVTLVVP